MEHERTLKCSGRICGKPSTVAASGERSWTQGAGSNPTSHCPPPFSCTTGTPPAQGFTTEPLSWKHKDPEQEGFLSQGGGRAGESATVGLSPQANAPRLRPSTGTALLRAPRHGLMSLTMQSHPLGRCRSSRFTKSRQVRARGWVLRGGPVAPLGSAHGSAMWPLRGPPFQHRMLTCHPLKTGTRGGLTQSPTITKRKLPSQDILEIPFQSKGACFHSLSGGLFPPIFSIPPPRWRDRGQAHFK